MKQLTISNTIYRYCKYSDIRRESKPVLHVAFAESRESTRNADSVSSSSLSAYRRSNENQPKTPSSTTERSTIEKFPDGDDTYYLLPVSPKNKGVEP